MVAHNGATSASHLSKVEALSPTEVSSLNFCTGPDGKYFSRHKIQQLFLPKTDNFCCCDGDGGGGCLCACILI